MDHSGWSTGLNAVDGVRHQGDAERVTVEGGEGSIDIDNPRTQYLGETRSLRKRIIKRGGGPGEGSHTGA